MKLSCHPDEVMEQVSLGMAKALFVSNWADECERIAKKTGERVPWPVGSEISRYAPEIPDIAFIEAGRLIGEIEKANQSDIYSLVLRAEDADDGLIDHENFGWYLAMQAMGHGISWFDSHGKFDLTVPRFEFRGQFEQENDQ